MKCRSHIFDGQATHGETAAYQLCDLHDEFLKEMVENEDDLREVCNVSSMTNRTLPTFEFFTSAWQERSGWYSTQAFEKIKTVLRYKWNSLQMNYVPTREDCERQLAAPEHKPFYGSRPTKHNMAKGAQRPEDEMVGNSQCTLWANIDWSRYLGQKVAGTCERAGEARYQWVVRRLSCTRYTFGLMQRASSATSVWVLRQRRICNLGYFARVLVFYTY